MSVSDIVDDERRRWSRGPGGGMIPFDTAYFDAQREQRSVTQALPDGRTYQQMQPTNADLWRCGVDATLDEFVEVLKARLAREGKR
jgi:hypothetical protein